MKFNLRITLVRELDNWKIRFNEQDFTSLINFFFRDKYYGFYSLNEIKDTKSKYEI